VSVRLTLCAHTHTAGLLLDDDDTTDMETDFLAETLPESLGLADADGQLVRLLRAGAPLPARRTRTLAYAAGQGSVHVALYAGEQPAAASNRLVAEARLTELAPAGGSVDVVLHASAAGEVTLSVQDKTTHAAARVVVPVAP
jgi:molecular chaperone DnaK (HSP70)